MDKKEKKKVFDLYSKDERIGNLINSMKFNPKNYQKLLSALQSLGEFDGKAEVDIYDSVEKEEGKKIRLWCSDLSDNLFIFYAISNERNDMLKIIKETNDESYEYDLLLAKKFNITSENIELTKCGKVNNFKFGRLITDDKSFYSLFMGGDIVYQISGNFDKVLTSCIVNRLNNFKELPTLSEFIKIFEMILLNSSCYFSKLKILAFKEGKKIGNIFIEEQGSNKNNYLKRIK